MTRRVVWEGQHERLTMEEKPGGGVDLMRSCDHDGGPTSFLAIPAEAVGLLAAQLIGEAEFGAMLDKLGYPR